MAKFVNPNGVEVSAADAKIGSNLRPGFKEILSDGEYLHSNIMMMDAAPTQAMHDAKALPDQSTIDDLVKAIILSHVEREGITPQQWIANADPRAIERIAFDAVKKFLSSALAKGIGSSLSLDSHAATVAMVKAVNATDRLTKEYRAIADRDRAKMNRHSQPVGKPGVKKIDAMPTIDAQRRARFA